MNMRTSSFRLALCALALCTGFHSAWAQVEPGKALPLFSLQDQHGRPWHVMPKTQMVIYAASRQASALVQAVVGAQAKGFLATRQAVYLANMSRMPGFITRSFALPALREQPFDVGVVLDEQVLATWPVRADALTLITLKEGVVQGIAFASTEAQLRAALGLQP
jgi:hypothetical protein